MNNALAFSGTRENIGHVQWKHFRCYAMFNEHFHEVRSFQEKYERMQGHYLSLEIQKE